MARVNVWLPDSLAQAARAGGVNVSNLTQVAVGRELAQRSITSWLQRVALERVPGVTHEMIVTAAAPAGPVAVPDTDPAEPLGLPLGAARAGQEHLVLGACAVLDLLLTVEMGTLLESVLGGHTLHAPAHLDGEVLAALARLEEGGLLRTPVERHLATLAAAPIRRHPLHALSAGAWRRRPALDLERAFYVELASILNARLITTV